MNWDAVGAIAELVGALAVVATLVYLATQIRQSNLSARVGFRLEMTRQYSDFVDGLLGNPDHFRVWLAGLSGENLNPEQKRLFRMLMDKCYWYFSAQHHQYNVHSLTEDEWHQSRSLMKSIAKNHGAEQWWDRNKEQYAPSFVEYMDTEIRRDV